MVYWVRHFHFWVADIIQPVVIGHFLVESLVEIRKVFKFSYFQPLCLFFGTLVAHHCSLLGLLCNHGDSGNSSLFVFSESLFCEAVAFHTKSQLCSLCRQKRKEKLSVQERPHTKSSRVAWKFPEILTSSKAIPTPCPTGLIGCAASPKRVKGPLLGFQRSFLQKQKDQQTMGESAKQFGKRQTVMVKHKNIKLKKKQKKVIAVCAVHLPLVCERISDVYTVGGHALWVGVLDQIQHFFTPSGSFHVALYILNHFLNGL